MSQEKVEYKKNLKANRKKINHQKKMKSILASVIAIVIVVAAVVWVGYSVRTKRLEAKADAPKATTEINLSSISDYMTDLTSEINDTNEE